MERHTQKMLILDGMLRGECITLITAREKKYGRCFALSQRCGELLREGYPITRSKERNKENTGYHGMYYIAHKSLARAKAMRKERGE